MRRSSVNTNSEPEWVRDVWIRQVTLCVRLQQWEAAIETFYEPWHREDRRRMAQDAETHRWFSCEGYHAWWHTGGQQKHDALIRKHRVAQYDK